MSIHELKSPIYIHECRLDHASGQSYRGSRTHTHAPSSLPRRPQVHTMHACSYLACMQDRPRPRRRPHSKTHVASVKPHGHMRVRGWPTRPTPPCAPAQPQLAHIELATSPVVSLRTRKLLLRQGLFKSSSEYRSIDAVHHHSRIGRGASTTKP